jgi:hypothetical protein
MIFTPKIASTDEVILGEAIIIANFGTANEIELGATRGDNVLNVARTIRDIAMDGTYGSVKGFSRVTQELATLKINALELCSNAVNLYCSTSIGTGTDNAGGKFGAAAFHKISSDLDVSDSDYFTNVAAVGFTKSGKPVAAIIHNALGDSNINYAFKNHDEVVADVTFSGNYENSGTPSSIWEVRYYDAAVTADTTPPTVTVSPSDTTSGVAVTANVVWTFTEAIDANKITSGNFQLIKASDGTEVDGALTYNATRTVVTFDPTASLTGSSAAYIAIASSNVTDDAGNHLAANSITNFSTT